MKVGLKIATVLVLALLSAGKGYGQMDSCLVLWQYSALKPHNVVWVNPDSVMVDTCQGPGHLYAKFSKKGFGVYFQYYILPDTLAPLGDSQETNWRKIDAKYSRLRDACLSLENRFGPFMLQHHIEPPPNNADTNDFSNKVWYFNFLNYRNIDTMVYYLRQLPELNPNFDPNFYGYPSFYEAVYGAAPGDHVRMWPQPCNSELMIQGAGAINRIMCSDLRGREVAVPIVSSVEDRIRINVSRLTSGIYQLLLDGKVFKFLVKR